MIIALSGKAGSGKSTIAKKLAEKLNYKHYSMGDLQREIAKEKGISIIELGEIEKKDDSIDRMLDEKQIALGKNEDAFVIDGWLAGHFIPRAVKIFLDGDIEVRAKRICKKREAEDHTDLQEAIKATKQREKTNQERFLNFYKYDCFDHKNYDLVIDTTRLNQEEVFEKVLKYVNNRKK